MSYITQPEVKQYLGINWESDQDTFIDTLIAAAERFVEEFCGNVAFGKRIFKAPSPDNDVTKYFNGSGGKKLYIGDARSITSLSVDGVALTVNTDYYTYPLNAVAEGKPIEWIELVQPETNFSNQNPRSAGAVPYEFESLQRNIVVVGKWGYSALPPEGVKVSVMKVVGGIIKENIGDNDLREVSSETIGDYSTTFSSIKNVANRVGVDALLAPYVRQSRKSRGKILVVS